MCCYRIPTRSFAYRSCHESSHSFATLFSEFEVILPHPFSIAITTFQLFSDHLSSSQFLQLFSTALKVVPSLPPSPQLFSPLPCSSQLSPMTSVFTRLNSPQLSLLLATSSTLPISSQLHSTVLTSFSVRVSRHLIFSTVAGSSQLLSPPVTASMRCLQRSIELIFVRLSSSFDVLALLLF